VLLTVAVALSGVLKFKTCLRNTILDVFRGCGWKESDSEYDWDIYWTNKEWIRGVYDKVHLEAGQRVNHFRNFFELTRKDLLVKNLKRQKRLLSKQGREDEAAAYDFFPETFCLPAEYALFVEAFKRAGQASWIMKPIGSSQGKGIFLFERLAQIAEWKNSYTAASMVNNNAAAAAAAAAGGGGAQGGAKEDPNQVSSKHILFMQAFSAAMCAPP
jgi:tubulin polyglutamylase TTLL9